MKIHYLVFNSTSKLLTDIWAGTKWPANFEGYELQPFEYEYFMANYASLIAQDGYLRFIMCNAGEGEAMSLQSGVSFRYRTADELNADSTNPLYKNIYVEVITTPQDKKYDGPTGIMAFPDTSEGTFDIDINLWYDAGKLSAATQIDGIQWILVVNKLNPRTGEVLDSVRPMKTFTAGTCSFTVNPVNIPLPSKSGRYAIDQRDFLPIEIPGLGKFQFVILNPNSESWTGRKCFEFDIYTESI